MSSPFLSSRILFLLRSKPITWFLSGSTKHQIDSLSSNEALKMENLIKNKNWEVQLDMKATNTAENFAYFRSWIEKQNNVEIYVVTSEFHHMRASSILSGIINMHVNWILSPKSCKWCYSDEKFHFKNVQSDIENALRVYDEL